MSRDDDTVVRTMELIATVCVLLGIISLITAGILSISITTAVILIVWCRSAQIQLKERVDVLEAKVEKVDEWGNKGAGAARKVQPETESDTKKGTIEPESGMEKEG